MREDWVSWLLIFSALLFTAAFIYNFAKRADQMLKRWAERNHYDLEEASFRMFRKGPFWWSSRSQVVYRVAVRGEDGRLRKGWVRLGHWFLGLMQEAVEEKWDEEEIY